MTIVAVTRHIPAPGIGPLEAAGFEVNHRDVDAPASAEEIIEIASGAAGLFCLLTERIDDAVLAACPELRVVANMAVGFDNIDVPAATARGVRVTNTPDVLTEATADLAWGLLLAAARRLGEGDRLVRAGEWGGWRPTELLGQRVGGATLGIFGMGKIGAAIARRGRGFAMPILYTNRSRSPEIEAETGATWVPFDELLARSDFISVNAPLTDETRHAFSSDQFAAMKPTAVLVNTARGPLVDEAALVTALGAGEIFSAGLDVFEREPELAAGLAGLENVVMAPHLGSSTTEARGAMVSLACENIVRVLGGEEPVTPLN